LAGDKLNGGFNLVRLKAGEKNWLLIKEKDEYASNETNIVAKLKKKTMPKDIKPMLAKRVDEIFDRQGWIFEIKWDGYRAIAEVDAGKVKLYSRNNLDLKQQFPPIVTGLQAFKGRAIFDGEIIAMKNGRPDFHALQNAGKKTRIMYVVFDLLYINDEDLRRKPLRDRKEKLKNLFRGSPNIMIADYVEDEGKKVFQSIKKQQMEGVIAKDGASAYLEGVRSNSWLKIKNIETQEAIIIGFTEPKGGRKYLGSLVLGAYDSNELKFIGHSGGGFSGKEIKELYDKLVKVKTGNSPVREKVPINSPITWVKPKYVCTVSFTEWPPDGRMRHPVYLGLRSDKKVKEVTREPVASQKELVGAEAIDVKVTNSDKVFWPKEGYTKQDVIDYYNSVADYMLPYLKDRPQNMYRHPNGIKKPGFYHKYITTSVPAYVAMQKIWSEHNKDEINYLLCQNKETLLYMVNLGCIEINPWNSKVENVEKPDYMIIDLDPGKKKFDDLIVVAKEVKQVLDLACADSYIKTSGKSGLHIFVPLAAKYSYEQIKDLSLLIVKIVNGRIPKITSIERTPAKRGGKIYLDYLQNRRGQTIAAAYSLRPVPGASVSTPLEWKEVRRGLDPKKFTIKTIHARLKKKGDLWKPVLGKGIDLRKSLQCLEKNVKEEI